MAARLRPLTPLALVLAAAFAGCADDAPATDGIPVPEVLDPGTWQSETYEGDFATTAVFSAGAFILGPGAVEVPADAKVAFFNGTVSGAVPDETVVRLVADDCSAEACEVETMTSGGSFSVMAEEPSPGGWSVVLFAGTAAQAGSWTIEVAALVASGDA